MQLAAQGGHADVTRLLLEAGADASGDGGSDTAPLQAAVGAGRGSCAKLLGAYDVDFDVALGEEARVAGVPCSHGSGHVACITHLLEHGASCSLEMAQEVLRIAACTGHGELVRLALERGASAQDKMALLRAAAGGHAACLGLLLSLGCDPDARDGVGRTALHHAAHGGHAECASVLINHGADVRAVDGAGETALHLAAEGGHGACVRVLLDVGASPAATAEDGVTPLQLAVRCGFADCVRLMMRVERGTYAMVEGMLARAGAAQAHYEKCCVVLRREGARHSFTRNKLVAAARQGHVRCARMLLANGVPWGWTSPYNWYRMPPLHVAASEGHARVVRMLLSRGADWQRHDGKGKTALQVAKGDACRKLLREHQARMEAKASSRPATAAMPGPTTRDGQRGPA